VGIRFLQLLIYDWEETLEIRAVNKLNVLVTYGYNRRVYQADLTSAGMGKCSTEKSPHL